MCTYNVCTYFYEYVKYKSIMFYILVKIWYNFQSFKNNRNGDYDD